MHLMSYHKLLPPGVHASSQQSSFNVEQQGLLLRTCSGENSHLPLAVISGGGAVQLLPRLSAGDTSALSLYPSAAAEGETPLDVWAVIRPGHVREKIAIFAAEAGRTAAAGSEQAPASSSERRMFADHPSPSGTPRAVKAKGSWDETCSPKRRRRAGNNQNLQQDQRTLLTDTQHNSTAASTLSDSTCQAPRRGGDGAVAEGGEAEEQKVSVGEMVAILEQRASQQQPKSKALRVLQRSSTTITLCRAPPPEVTGEGPESIRVSDMVARLESECVRRRAEGTVSRSSSLRRSVGRVLLAAGEQGSTPPSPLPRPLPHAQRHHQGRGPIGRSGTQRTEALSAQASPPDAPPSHPSGVEVGRGVGASLETQNGDVLHKVAEPVPGLLFMSPPPTASSSPPRPLDKTVAFDLVPHLPIDSGQSETKRRKADPGQEAGARRASVSHDFLEMRQRLQQLLEPQPYLSVLPHHLLVKIFLLLPTQSLAALKCTCHDFKFVIENYDVRPADSLWVSDPRYRDDPCKQCKRRYRRGDVSLCRWHHKPYCQALPYGPGYWMCCHGAHRDAPGCNVGLHDNRWVPAFHSINVPIYRRSCGDD